MYSNAYVDSLRTDTQQSTLSAFLLDQIHTFDPESYILSTTLYVQYEDVVNVYKQYSRVLVLHLQNDITIVTRTAPRAAIIQQEQSM